MTTHIITLKLRKPDSNNGSLRLKKKKHLRDKNQPQMVMMMLMDLYTYSIFKCALQASDLWVRSDISIYRPLSVVSYSSISV